MDLNMVEKLIKEDDITNKESFQNNEMKVNPKFEISTWYRDIVYYLMHHEWQNYMNKSHARYLML